MRPLVRDKDLLDALERLPMSPLTGHYWRSVREDRDPIECSRSGGRWDDATFDVLYTSSTKEGAIAERRFHLFKGQPIPPSKVRYELHRVKVGLASVITFSDLNSLSELGMNVAKYGVLSYLTKQDEYPTSQAIGECCFFLGADGIIVPNARQASSNLVLFCEQDPPPQISPLDCQGIIDFG